MTLPPGLRRWLLAALPAIAALAASTVSSAVVAAAPAKALETSDSCPLASVYPTPGSRSASPTSQISLENVSPAEVARGQVSVVGSESGSHSGRWVANADGQGASFFPSKPFQSGETVTVSAPVAVCGARSKQYSFRVAETAPKATVPSSKPAPVSPSAQPTESFVSLPGVQIPKLKVKIPSSLGGGYIFESPKGGSKLGGPEIVDGQGQPVWFDPLPAGESACDFEVQIYQGQPVLTWWQGYIVDGHGRGEDVIMNSSYQVIATVHAGNGFQAGLHAFKLDAGGNAWITADNTIGWDLKSVGGPKRGAVIDGVVQEIDPSTGNVMFEWNALDHVAPNLSAFSYTKGQVYDYFHVNAVDPRPDGTVVISSRNTDAVYAVNQSDGRVLWRLGGKKSSSSMGEGTVFRLQHNAEMHGNNVISIFDDEDASPSNRPARAIVLGLNFQERKATLLWAVSHGSLKVSSQGNVEPLANGNIFVGWGQGGYTSEYSQSGKLLFDADYGSAIDSYRAYLSSWVGTPKTAPGIAVSHQGGGLSVLASWNGSTQTTSWTVLAGGSASALSPVATQARHGFQTAIPLSTAPAYVQVEALGASGQVLARSGVIAA